VSGPSHRDYRMDGVGYSKIVEDCKHAVPISAPASGHYQIQV
jgi:hypothetical protein